MLVRIMRTPFTHQIVVVLLKEIVDADVVTVVTEATVVLHVVKFEILLLAVHRSYVIDVESRITLPRIACNDGNRCLQLQLQAPQPTELRKRVLQIPEGCIGSRLD